MMLHGMYILSQELLENHDIQRQREYELQKSASVLFSLLNNLTQFTVLAVIASGKHFSKQTLQTMADTTRSWNGNCGSLNGETETFH
jgi:hypothetical protein